MKLPFMKKISVPQLILEFISVVFAVLLALGLNSFKQSLDQKASARQLKNAIISECERNLIKLDSVFSKNQGYAEYLDSLVRLEPEDITGFYFTFEFELLTNGAWQIAQNNTDINRLDPEFLLNAADLYHMQDFYTEFSSNVFQNVGNTLIQKDKVSNANMAISMYYNVNVMFNAATDLKKSYKEFLEKYDK